MSFYRTVFAAIVAASLAAPVLADDLANPAQNPADNNPVAMQVAEANAGQATPDQPATQSKLNLNKATAQELMKIKGVNASKARAIVAWRKKHEKEGGFKSIDDLSSVKGFKKMKPETLKEIQDQVTVE